MVCIYHTKSVDKQTYTLITEIPPLCKVLLYAYTFIYEFQSGSQLRYCGTQFLVKGSESASLQKLQHWERRYKLFIINFDDYFSIKYCLAGSPRMLDIYLSHTPHQLCQKLKPHLSKKKKKNKVNIKFQLSSFAVNVPQQTVSLIFMYSWKWSRCTGPAVNQSILRPKKWRTLGRNSAAAISEKYRLGRKKKERMYCMEISVVLSWLFPLHYMYEYIYI